MWMHKNMNVCVYVCVCIYEHTGANTQYGCAYACRTPAAPHQKSAPGVCVCVCVCMCEILNEKEIWCVCVWDRKYVVFCIFMCISVYICVYIYVCVCIYIYINI